MSASPRPDDDGIETVTLDELKSGTVNTYDRVAGRDVDVPGHRYDLPDDRLPLRIVDDDGGERILMSSDMTTDPVEGTTGTYTVHVRADEPCPECGHDWTQVSVETFAGVHVASCAYCGDPKPDQ